MLPFSFAFIVLALLSQGPTKLSTPLPLPHTGTSLCAQVLARFLSGRLSLRNDLEDKSPPFLERLRVGKGHLPGRLMTAQFSLVRKTKQQPLSAHTVKCAPS